MKEPDRGDGPDLSDWTRLEMMGSAEKSADPILAQRVAAATAPRRHTP